jgi:hypothetical protein
MTIQEKDLKKIEKIFKKFKKYFKDVEFSEDLSNFFIKFKFKKEIFLFTYEMNSYFTIKLNDKILGKKIEFKNNPQFFDDLKLVLMKIINRENLEKAKEIFKMFDRNPVFLESWSILVVKCNINGSQFIFTTKNDLNFSVKQNGKKFGSICFDSIRNFKFNLGNLFNGMKNQKNNLEQIREAFEEIFEKKPSFLRIENKFTVILELRKNKFEFTSFDDSNFMIIKNGKKLTERITYRNKTNFVKELTELIVRYAR